MKIIQSGSDRLFIIIKNKVFLIDHNKESLQKYLKIREFLEKNSINVPKLYFPFTSQIISQMISENHSKEIKSLQTVAVLQNLGENLFYVIKNYQNKLKNNIQNWIIKKYLQIIKEISKIHNIKINPLNLKIQMDLQINLFDLKVLRWEWRYFIENFWVNYLGKYDLSKWFEISEIVVNNCYNIFKSCPTLIHRDLQSTNVIFYKNKPYFIDFQGMMIGNFLYDLASLIEDPYIMLPNSTKQKLLNFYFKINPHFRKLEKYYKYYKIQRLVQVLGAFAFLSIHKNKPFFIEQLKKYPLIFKEITKTIKSI